MNNTILDQAATLANRSYRYEIRLDETTTGQPIYFAACLDLEGCFAQGQTIEEALHNLILAQIDYIYSLLEDHQPVPDPIPVAVASTATAGASTWQPVTVIGQPQVQAFFFQPAPSALTPTHPN